MTTPLAAHRESEFYRQSVKQEQPAVIQSTTEAQDSHMAAGKVDFSWTPFHGLPPDYDDYVNALSSSHQSLTWASTSSAPDPIVQSSDYQLDTIPEHVDIEAYATMSRWSGSTCTPMNSLHHAHFDSTADPGRPRTFPTMDATPMLSDYEATIAPHDLYQAGTPQSNPYAYGDEPDVYTHRNIATSIEDYAPLQSSQFDFYSHQNVNPSYRSTPLDEDASMDEDETFEGEKHEPYAKSLFRCLRDAPGHTMVLRDIYDWFKANTARGKEPHEKGWQNSIRHNLSMNKAFEKIEVTSPDEPTRRGYQWRLSDQALRDNRVQSTTRFRNKQPNKRGHRSHNPAPHRQASGAKGGRMARFAAEARRSERLREARHNLRQSYHNLRSSGIIPSNMSALSHGTSISLPVSPHAESAFVAYSEQHGTTSGPSTPYQPIDQVYDWNQHPQFMSSSGIQTPQPEQHDPYFIPSDVPTITPAMSPDTHWGPISDRVFYDSSDSNTPLTPQTPQSFVDIGMDHNILAIGNHDGCRL